EQAGSESDEDDVDELLGHRGAEDVGGVAGDGSGGHHRGPLRGYRRRPRGLFVTLIGRCRGHASVFSSSGKRPRKRSPRTCSTSRAARIGRFQYSRAKAPPTPKTRPRKMPASTFSPHRGQSWVRPGGTKAWS